MAIGERIRFIRNLRNMTQKYLGQMVGFDAKTADVRMAQYESGTRTPKADLTATLAHVLDVSPQALNLPEIDSDEGLMHTLFALEDLRGLQIGEIDGEICLRLDKFRGMTSVGMFNMFTAWQKEFAKLKAGEITKEEYDQWRYHYPNYDTTERRSKVISQELSDYIVEAHKEKE